MAYTIAKDGVGSSAPDVAHDNASLPDIVHRNGSDLHLTPDAVERLAASTPPHQSGDVQPAALSHPVVGHVGQVVGDATVLRNGVEVPLHVGDAIFQGDVIQTGAASAVGISFPDGTALNLVANSQMAINAYSYEANSAANGAHFTLIDGTFGFVAGKVAHDGDMKISTPVATMVVHGGAGWAHELSQSEITAISATLGDVTYSFAVVDDRGVDTHGLYDLLLNGAVVSSIDDPHLIWYFDQHGDLLSRPLDDADRLFAGGLFHDFDQWLDVNPQSLGIHGSGSSIDLPTFPQLVDLQQDAPSFNSSFTGGTPFGALPPLIDIPIRPVSNVFIWNGVGNWDLDPSDWNQGFAPTNANDIVTIQSGKASYSNFYTIASLTVDFGAILNIDGGSLTTSAIDNAGLIQLNASGSDPALIINGAIDLVGGGAIHMLGPSFDNFILGVPGSGAMLINIDNVIDGSGNIGDGDHNLSFVNEASVDATPILPGDSGLLIIDTGNAVANSGLFEATGGGELLVGDLLVNSGLVQAVGAGSSVVIDNHSAVKGKTLPGNADINTGTVQAIAGGLVEFDQDSFGNADNGLVVAAGKGSEVEFKQSLIANEGRIVALQHGAITFGHDRVENDQGAVILAKGRGSEAVFDHSRIDNGGTIEAAHWGLVTFGDSDIDNNLHGTIEAKGWGSAVGFDLDDVSNQGLIGATGGGFLAFGRSLVDNAYSGVIEADSRGSEVELDRDLVKNSGLVGAGWSGTLRFDRSLIWNACTGVIAAVWDSEVKFKHDDVANSGLIAAAYGGEVAFDKSHVYNGYSGAIEAQGWWSSVAFYRSHVRNAGLIEAAKGGLVTFDLSHIRNGSFGVIAADGRSSEVVFEASHVGNSGLIAAEKHGEIEFDWSHVDNKRAGTIGAAGFGSEVSFDDSHVHNAGLIEAINRGEVEFDWSRVHNDDHGTIEAKGHGSEVEFDGGKIDNQGLIKAVQWGTVEFEQAHTDNQTQGTIEAKGFGSEIAFDQGNVTNDGLIEAGHTDEVSLTGTSIHNESGGRIEALGDGSEVDISSGDLRNEGLIKAGHGGTVTLSDLTVDNGNGVIEATGAGATVQLEDVAIDHGEIKSSNGGLIELDGGTAITGGLLVIGAAGGTGTVDVEGAAGAALHDVMVTGAALGDNLEVGVTNTSTLTMDSGTTMTGGTLTIGTQGTLQVDPSLAILSGVNLVNHGTIVIDPGLATLTVENDTTVTGGNINVGAQGTLDIDGSTLTHVDISDSGVVDIGNDDTFDPSDVLSFVGHSTLDVDGNSALDLTLAGLTAGDVIDLKGEVVDSAVWNGSALFLNGSQVAFTVSGELPAGDTFAFKPDGNGGTDLAVRKQILSISGSPASGVENSPIKISFNTVTGGASLTSFVISDIPAGVTLSDGHGHQFTATAQLNSIDVHGWHLKSLTITSTTAGDFTVSALATVTDSHGYSYSALATEAVTVTVPPGPPVFSSGSTASVNEGVAPNTIVYTAVSADPQNAPITYSLTGTDASHFAIDANSGAVSILTTPSFETQSVYTFTVVAGDQGLTAQKAVTIDVNDLPPTFNSPTTAAVNEGSPASSVVYTAQATEPGGGTLTYSLSGQDAAAFNLNAATGALTLKSVPSYDVQHTYDVVIQANETNGGMLSADQNVAITVNPVAATFSSPATAQVNEGVPAGTTVYTAQASEPGGGSLTYSLVGGLHDDAANFSINSATGAVSIDVVPNFHTQDIYHFTVEATEQSGLSSNEAVTLDINAVPLAVTAGATVHFTGGSAPVVLDSTLTVTDGESPTAQASATVSIGAGFAPGDTLAFNGGANVGTFPDGAAIQGSYNSATGVLTLTEAAGSGGNYASLPPEINSGGMYTGPGSGPLLTVTPSVADFQAALQSVTFSAGLNDPTNGGSDTSRTIDWSFNDGAESSNTATSTVTTSHVAPTVTSGNNELSNSVGYLPGGSPIILNSGIEVTDNNGVGATLANAQVELLGAQSGDLLSFNNGTDTETFSDGATIHGVYQNGMLTLTEATGSSVTPSVADFQAALRTVAYSSTNGDPSIGGTDSKREIYWVVHDGNSTNGTNFVPPNPFDDQPVSNGQPTLGLNQLVVEQGVFPGFGGSSTSDAGGIPMGALRTFAGSTVLAGTASAEGQWLPIQQDTALFSLLGTNYGGNGMQTFGLPNLSGNVAVGAGTNLALGVNLTVGQSFGSDTIQVHQSNLPVQWGGADAPLNNDEPSLAVNFLINTGGSAPNSASAASTDVAGDVIQYLGPFVPSGYLVAAGQTLSIAEYPALYAAIGTTYGGDGVTTFKLPNLVGATIEGAGASYNGFGSVALGTVTASNQISLTANNLPPPQGSSLPVTNLHPSVALNYIIDIEGIYPSSSGAPAYNEGYLGEIMAYAGTDIPQGWVLAEGQTLSIDQYQVLFSILGTTYGGNGVTTFQLPDLVGRAVEGVGQTYFGQPESLGEQSGSNSFTLNSQNVGFPTVDTTTLGFLTSGQIDSWTNGTGDGNWSTAGNWSQGAAPSQYSAAALIGSAGSPTITGSVDLHNVQLQINGNINIAQGATFAIDNTVTLSESNGASITFTGATGELKLGTPASFSAAIDGFTGTAADTAHSDAIDLVGLNFASGQFSESYNPATGLLTVSDGSTSTSFTFNGFSAALDFASDGSGGTLITAQQANSVAVATGTLVELTGASNGTATFAGGTGELKIDNPANFTGHIDGFTGTAPDAAHSDAIDLVGLDYNAAGFHEQYNSSTGVLQVTDGTHTAQFTFDNFGGTLKFASDGHGGTMIFDPPAPTTPAPAVAATTASGDSFNFSFQPPKGAEAPAHFDWSHTTPIESHVPQQLSAWDAQSLGPEVHHQMDLVHSAITLQQFQAHLHSAVILH